MLAEQLPQARCSTALVDVKSYAKQQQPREMSSLMLQSVTPDVIIGRGANG